LTFEFFSPFPFYPRVFLGAVIGLLLGLLGVKKGFRKSHQGGQFFTMEQLGVVAGNLAPSSLAQLFEHFCAYLRFQ